MDSTSPVLAAVWTLRMGWDWKAKQHNLSWQVYNSIETIISWAVLKIFTSKDNAYLFFQDEFTVTFKIKQNAKGQESRWVITLWFSLLGDSSTCKRKPVQEKVLWNYNTEPSFSSSQKYHKDYKVLKVTNLKRYIDKVLDGRVKWGKVYTSKCLQISSKEQVNSMKLI